jgi:hypothetical protein
MWRWVTEGSRLLAWLEAAQLLEPAGISGPLGEALLRVIRDEEAGPQVATRFKDTVRVLCCAALCCALLSCLFVSLRVGQVVVSKGVLASGRCRIVVRLSPWPQKHLFMGDCVHSKVLAQSITSVLQAPKQAAVKSA